ncbi:MAG TPA: class I SAM-dependent methyltransferase [Burkholderiales bacterium]
MTAVYTPVPGAGNDDAPLPKALRAPIARGELRDEAQLREHYLIERELADRLRRAAPDERRRLYAQVYDELYRRVPHHPMNRPSGHPRAAGVERDLVFLRRFLRPTTAFLEIGAGDCALACRVAAVVRRVVAVDVSEEIMRLAPSAMNLERALSDGTSIPVRAGSIDVAFSDQLMEHLHPDDAAEQLRNIHRALAPGGVYLCITPNRLYGPRDISGYFDDVATGFHLREYTGGELAPLFRSVGFSRLRFYAGARGWYLPVPAAPVHAAETALEMLPAPARRRVAGVAPVRALLGLRVAAIK